MVFFCSTPSKRLMARSVQSSTASILCGVLFLTPLAINVAFADTNSALDTLMSDAISQTQKMVSLMTGSCPGGPHGENPLHYEEFVNDSNLVASELVAIRLGLAKGETLNAGQQIDAVEGLLENMVALMSQSCSGGAHGEDPFHYGEIITIKDRVTEELEGVKTAMSG